MIVQYAALLSGGICLEGGLHMRLLSILPVVVDSGIVMLILIHGRMSQNGLAMKKEK